MTRSQVANDCRLSRAAVWRMAVGEAREPSFQTVRSVERLYEVKVGPSPLRR